jgi:hypothetical protein
MQRTNENRAKRQTMVNKTIQNKGERVPEGLAVPTQHGPPVVLHLLQIRC